jgi:hypothetical protein
MTAAEATRLAQTDPTPTMVARFGEYQMEARARLANLVITLRQIDTLREQLADHNITVSVDLGPIGNAAAAARRDLEKQRDTPTFQMPTAGEPLPTKADPHLTHPQKRI